MDYTLLPTANKHLHTDGKTYYPGSKITDPVVDLAAKWPEKFVPNPTGAGVEICTGPVGAALALPSVGMGGTGGTGPSGSTLGSLWTSLNPDPALVPTGVILDGATFNDVDYPDLVALGLAVVTSNGDGTSTFALNGDFIRPTTNPAEVGVHVDATTGQPTVPFTGIADTAGAHTHTVFGGGSLGTNTSVGGSSNRLRTGQTRTTSSSGDHTHTVTIDGGGDLTTAPNHIGAVVGIWGAV